MSLLAFTADLRTTLAKDLSTGQWTPTTAMFFQRLYTRVGGQNAPTNLELAALVTPGLEADVANLLTTVDAQFTALQQAVAFALHPELRLADVAPAHEAVAAILYAMLAPASDGSLGLGDLGPSVEGTICLEDLAPRYEALPGDVAAGVNTI